MKEEIKKQIQNALKNLGIEGGDFNVEHPEISVNGDYSTNVAMVSAKKLGMNPRELAEKIVNNLRQAQNEFPEIKEIQVAGPGFINFYLSREFFTEKIYEILKKGENWGKNKKLLGQKIMVEYTDPNPFKPFHIGHLMTNAIGESISRVIEFAGAHVVRANYQGDVGPHVAKAIYGLMKFGLPEDESLSVSAKAKYIGECYAKGNDLYETDESLKKEIDEINKKIYAKSDDEINKIYEWGRKVTLEAFEEIYKILYTKFDRYFFESEMAPIGRKLVLSNKAKIFEESDGAIVFHGEKYDPSLHTRVFINSQGLPTYEAKEIGLIFSKFKKGFFEKGLNLSITTTAIEQAEYMKVVQKAISLINPKLEKKMKHITHGMMKLASGKMSSRKGNVVTGESLLTDAMTIVHEKITDREMGDEERTKIARQVGVSALKYSILKSSLGSDIIYDQEKSISFEGDSGPYLQYTAVRAQSILDKALVFDIMGKSDIPEEVNSLEKIIYQLPEVVDNSYTSLEPHHLTVYLTKLSSEFNTFYNQTKILDENNKSMAYHLDLVKAFYQTMKNGLWLLGIEIPEKM